MCSEPGMPQVVGRPATLLASLTVIRTPSSGRRSPRASALSASAAATRARSKSRTTTALSLPSCASMRAIASLVQTTERPDRISPTAPVLQRDLIAGGDLVELLSSESENEKRCFPTSGTAAQPRLFLASPRDKRRVGHGERLLTNTPDTHA